MNANTGQPGAFFGDRYSPGTGFEDQIAPYMPQPSGSPGSPTPGANTYPQTGFPLPPGFTPGGGLPVGTPTTGGNPNSGIPPAGSGNPWTGWNPGPTGGPSGTPGGFNDPGQVNVYQASPMQFAYGSGPGQYGIQTPYVKEDGTNRYARGFGKGNIAGLLGGDGKIPTYQGSKGPALSFPDRNTVKPPGVNQVRYQPTTAGQRPFDQFNPNWQSDGSAPEDPSRYAPPTKPGDGSGTHEKFLQYLAVKGLL